MFTEIKKENTTKNKIIRLGTTRHLTKMTDENNELLPIFKKIKTNFSVALKKYYAGMIDGDGNIIKENKKRKLQCKLELTEDAALPITELADIFDLSVSKRVRSGEKYKNTKPTLTVILSGFKAKFFLINIYPYMLEKKEECKASLISAGCPEHFFEDPFMEYRKFSYEYLAGYTDAEGCIGMYKYINKAYTFHYCLTSTNFEQINFISKNLKKDGFKIKIKTDNYKRIRDGIEKTYKTSYQLYVNGSHKDLTKLYNKLLPFMKIEKKIKRMKNTIKYNEISNMIDRRKNEME